MSKRVLITGAAGGIGVAATEEMRKRGARVVGLDLHDDGDGVIACDVRDQASVDSAVAEAIERLGGLDVLVNNAGLGNPQSAGKPPDEAALAVLDVNLIGPWRVTSAAIDALRESRGRVINVASGLAHLAVPLAPAYAMSKRGLVAYSDSLRYEHGDAITVTTVYPGYIRTAIHRASEEAGFGLEGIVPAEPVESAARTLAHAALGERGRRDLATTHRGTFSYWLARVSPRPLVDSVVMGYLRRLARGGKIAERGMGAELVGRLRASRRR
jgi:NAD(P)-dependent dehydrogenase (short-subunit alcohol dehydrogenase family)